MLSGLKSKYDERHMERMKRTISEHGGSFVEIPVDCMAIRDLFVKYGLEVVDFISIDTEGGELDILRSIDFTTLMFKAVIVENNYSDPHFRLEMERNGFEFVAKLEGDEIYLNKKAFSFFQLLMIKWRAKKFNYKLAE
jgi:hypothetical protein